MVDLHAYLPFLFDNKKPLESGRVSYDGVIFLPPRTLTELEGREREQRMKKKTEEH